MFAAGRVRPAAGRRGHSGWWRSPAAGHAAIRARRPIRAPKLQAATTEIRDIARSVRGARSGRENHNYWPERDGSAAALRGIWGSGADVVHFATHALADLRQPLASLLMLPAKDAQGTPTYLTAGQVQEWRGDAELVFLSACESAIGPPRFAGGMPGLQSAFLRAGARGVIATLWPIEDVLAREFSADFYAALHERRVGARRRSAKRNAPGWRRSPARAKRSRCAPHHALAHGFYTLKRRLAFSRCRES